MIPAINTWLVVDHRRHKVLKQAALPDKTAEHLYFVDLVQISGKQGEFYQCTYEIVYYCSGAKKYS